MYDVAAFAYDAAAAAALALAAAADPNDGDQLIAAMQTISFDGASGQVRFTATGDREPTSAGFRLLTFSFDGGTGVLSRKRAANTRIGAAQQTSIVNNPHIVWRGGSFVDDLTMRTSCPQGYVLQPLEGRAVVCVGEL